MTSADLNGDGRPDLIVGYVDAPGIIYYNDGPAGTSTRTRSAMGREQSMGWPAATWMETGGST